MPKMKKFLAVILFVAIALFLTACQESSESKYSRANKLLAEAKYDEAVKLFEEIGTYEDSSKMAMYGKAIAAAENGEYKAAISSFQALGNYKDCPMMITYYTARQYEDQATDVNWTPRVMAAEFYETIALFLDSRDRAENNRKAVYDQAVLYAETEQYAQSMEMLAALKDYEDSSLLRRYYEAFSLEQQNKFTEASRCFAALEDYRDSRNQATEVLKRGYQSADAQERAGKQEAAYEIFMNLAETEYEDSFERANKPYYDLGMSLREKENYVDAIAAFEHAGSYNDAETQVKETKYMQAFAKREQQNWDAATEIFTALGDYKDSTAVQINETNYQRADALEKKGDQEAAYEIWMSLGRYGDSFARANKPYYDLGVSLREDGKWDEAIAAFEHAGLYEDAAEQILATRYAEGEAKRTAQDWDGAREAFMSAGAYSDAEEQISATYYAEGICYLEQGQSKKAWDAFKNADNYADSAAKLMEAQYKYAKELLDGGNYDEAAEIFAVIRQYEQSDELYKEAVYRKAQALYSGKNYVDAAEVFSEIKDYQDATEMIRKCKWRTVGETVEFGRYEQDNNTSNKTEPIEWVVTDIQGNKVLLFSENSLDTQPYSNESGNITWEKSAIRLWLNKEFYSGAFNEEERAAIISVTLDNGKTKAKLRWETVSGGNDTNDKVFLLSIDELDNYNSVIKEYLQKRSSFARSKYKANIVGILLRSPGSDLNYIATSDGNGTVWSSLVDYPWYIQPAVWVNLESVV